MGEAVDLNADGAGGDAGGREMAGAVSPLRRGARLPVEATVRLRCEGRVGIHTGFVRDLSRGGMFLRIVDPEPAGRRLAFELWLPGRRSPARGLAEVAWQRMGYEGPGRPSGMALRFLALEGAAIAALGELMPGGEAPDVVRLERQAPTIELAEREMAEEASLEAALAATAESSLPAVACGGHLVGEPSLVVEPLFDLAPLFELEPLAADVPQGGTARPVNIVPSARRARRREGAATRLAEEAGSVEQLPLPLTAPPIGDVDPRAATAPPPVPSAPAPTAFPVAQPSGAAMVQPYVPQPNVPLLVVAASAPRPWRPAVAGTAAIAALATLAVVGAARFSGAPPPSPVEAVTSSPVALAAGAVPAAVAPAPRAAATSPVRQPVFPPSPASPRPAARVTGAASRVVALRWEPLSAGGTRVVVRLDGAFAAGRLRSSHIGGESPRQVVRLLGITGPVPTALSVATAEVLRIRAGRHQDEGASEVHLVLDLATPGVRVVATAVVGDELRLDLAPAGESVGG
ncbi:MAG TPA: PilZ domain-containing protein [Thermoanaerobaculia bacterium]|nr:PilZ domain-containing protein [Thermoanaerobaculia bacterium]